MSMSLSPVSSPIKHSNESYSTTTVLKSFSQMLSRADQYTWITFQLFILQWNQCLPPGLREALTRFSSHSTGLFFSIWFAVSSFPTSKSWITLDFSLWFSFLSNRYSLPLWLHVIFWCKYDYKLYTSSPGLSPHVLFNLPCMCPKSRQNSQK